MSVYNISVEEMFVEICQTKPLIGNNNECPCQHLSGILGDPQIASWANMLGAGGDNSARFVSKPFLFLWEWVIVLQAGGIVRPRAEQGWGWQVFFYTYDFIQL